MGENAFGIIYTYDGHVIGEIRGDIKFEVKREGENMKIIGVKFKELGKLSEKDYSFICAEEHYAQLKLGSEVIVNTKFGTAIGVVTIMDWKNPPIYPYKAIVSVVSPTDVTVATERELIVRAKEEEKKQKTIESLNTRMLKFANSFTPHEIFYALGKVNYDMTSMVRQLRDLGGFDGENIDFHVSQRRVGK